MVNNHVHTTYSFSPYTPREAVRRAKEAGLQTVGLMDHDSLGGVAEFLEAGREFGIATTIGVECRTDCSATPLAGRRLNSADQTGMAYVALHAVPHTKWKEADAYFQPVRVARGLRNRRMLKEINAETGLSLDYDRDVLPLSMAQDGGGVTERHLLYAVALRLQTRPAYSSMETYTLLGRLKVELLPRVYLPAGPDELLPIEDAARIAQSWGAIPAYAYLGDVKASVTGDKPDMAFEDAFLDKLFDLLPELGFRAVTYMPSRNTPAQLERVQALCRSRALFEISGEDINSPGQSFLCPALSQPAFAPLLDAAWALVASERAEFGLFAPESIRRQPDLALRVKAFADSARQLFSTPTQPV